VQDARVWVTKLRGGGEEVCKPILAEPESPACSARL